MPQDEKAIERKSGREHGRTSLGERRRPSLRRPRFLRAAAERGVVVAEPQPFRFFGTRIQEAVRVIKG